MLNAYHVINKSYQQTTKPIKNNILHIKHTGAHTVY